MSSELLDSIQVVYGAYTSFNEIIKCFAQVRHAQTALESVSSLTMTLFLAMIQQIETSLSVGQGRIQQSDSLSAISVYSPTLTQHIRSAIDRIDMHDLSVVTCLIHPGLRSISFFTDVVLRNGAKTNGFYL